MLQKGVISNVNLHYTYLVLYFCMPKSELTEREKFLSEDSTGFCGLKGMDAVMALRGAIALVPPLKKECCMR